MTVIAAPLLRSPPFPGVPARIAAVSTRAYGPTTIAANDAPTAALLDQIRVARVGGSFWGARPTPGPDVRRWCMVDTLDDVRRWRLAKGANAADTLIVAAPHLLPLATVLRRSCAQLFVGVVDPWHLFEHIEQCIAEPGSELALLAAIACARTSGSEGGCGTDAIESSLFHGLTYRNPFTGGAASLEQAVRLLSYWREVIDRNRSLATALGIARWKQPTIGTMLWSGSVDLAFDRKPRRAISRAAMRGGAVAIWPAKAPLASAAMAAAANVPLATVEDGFIRSRGLGSDCVPPLSIAVDGPRPHYDPGGPSRLESLIQNHRFDTALLTRAEHLVAMLIAGGVGKYDVGREGGRARPAAQRVVLIAGQVEDDASWLLGGAAIASNLDLLHRVRAAEPDAWLIFRPHPDVEAGHRIGHISDRDALCHVDEIDRRTPLSTLLDIVDAVHVLTSLTGFEALLRGREVVVHGMPFYAGWGVTRDLAGPVPRRTRRASVIEIAAAAYILYPHYLDPVTRLPCTPELLVERLIAGQGMPTSLLTRLRRLRRLTHLRRTTRLRRCTRLARAAG